MTERERMMLSIIAEVVQENNLSGEVAKGLRAEIETWERVKEKMEAQYQEMTTKIGQMEHVFRLLANARRISRADLDSISRNRPEYFDSVGAEEFDAMHDEIRRIFAVEGLQEWQERSCGNG